MENKKVVAIKGYGYYDITQYPYGGYFRRLSEDTEVELLETVKIKGHNEAKIKFKDGHVGVIQYEALKSVN